MRSERAFTLMELLVVLLIIGVLSTVALRTIDATRDRGLFDQTERELNELVMAMTGNPDLTYDGRRIDFGFFGDMGRLPIDLRELVVNTTGDTNWHGPYIRRGLTGDTVGFLHDAWGDIYSYNQGTGTIASLGKGKYPMTVRVVDSLPQLTENSVTGTITDRDGNIPNDSAVLLVMRFASGSERMTWVHRGGYYRFDAIPVGTHQMIASIAGGDSVARWVTVVPRSQAVVDLRFSRTFRSKLVVVGVPSIYQDTNNFTFSIINDGSAGDTVTINSVLLVQAPTPAWMTAIYVGGILHDSLIPPVGQGGTATMLPIPVPPQPAEPIPFQFMHFTNDSLGMGSQVNVRNQEFRLRFSDGSEITVTPQ
jgi:prepilin-type N-terminal cleavage/methylation domain-containing protein